MQDCAHPPIAKLPTVLWECKSPSDCTLHFRTMEISINAANSKWRVNCPSLDIQNIQIVKACPTNRYTNPETLDEAQELALDIVESRLIQYLSLMKEIKSSKSQTKEVA